jgi:hypothetical protein
MTRISFRPALRRSGSNRRPRCLLGVEPLEGRGLLSLAPVPIAPSDAFADVTSDNVPAQDGYDLLKISHGEERCFFSIRMGTLRTPRCTAST